MAASSSTELLVTPAKAGVRKGPDWMPVFTGMTKRA